MSAATDILMHAYHLRPTVDSDTSVGGNLALTQGSHCIREKMYPGIRIEVLNLIGIFVFAET